ncbi:hypothetical protein [Pseudoalteromonas pernae]|uniref:hypothetical protein n=1 Tax=Pseudoalteromonas pernae TaxID=3118054 RepID=UPI003242F0A5
MTINAAELAGNMLGAMQGVLSEKWPKIREYGEAEAHKLAQSLSKIQTLIIAGEIDEEEAMLHLAIQRNASQSVLLTLAGLSALAVEQALNAAFDAIKDTVNTALGFPLL